jgi:hypothetical protein
MAHCRINTNGSLAMQQSKEASTSATWKIMTNRASDGLSRRFWVVG